MIELRSVSKAIRERNGAVRPLFDDLDLVIRDEDRSLAVLGRSGAGKTTLLRILAGLDVDYSGACITDDGRLAKTHAATARHRRARIGMVSQSYDLLPDRSVAANVRLGCLGGANAPDAVAEALDRVGVGHLAKARPARLSGGEAQRVAIARAIVERPPLVLADEPTGALDEDTEDEVLALFDELQDHGTTFVVVTHSERVAEWCERRVVIQDRRLVALD